MIRNLLTLTARITRRDPSGPPDEYGNPTDVETITSARCEIQQTARQETEDGISDIQREEFSAWFAAGTDLDGIDRVTIAGTSYELVGPPWVARNPRTGRTEYVAARLRRTE